MATSQTTAGGNSSRMSRITKGKVLLLLKSSAVVAVFVICRLIISYFGWDLITFNSLVGSFVAGVYSRCLGIRRLADYGLDCFCNGERVFANQGYRQSV